MRGPLVNWVGLALATPVVFWAGWPFFERAWASLVNRSPNMFTLIAIGVGAAYGYSAVATIAPGVFPAGFRMHGIVETYFDTAAVITVGAATLAAFIGAGGLGEPIVAGLALADTNMILSGALPAAALALVVDGALALVERAVAPAHLRHTAER